MLAIRLANYVPVVKVILSFRLRRRKKHASKYNRSSGTMELQSHSSLNFQYLTLRIAPFGQRIGRRFFPILPSDRLSFRAVGVALRITCTRRDITWF